MVIIMKIGIVGTGQIAQRHLNAFQNLDDVQIVGHVGTNHEKAQAAALQWGGTGYARLHDLLDAEQPDAVWITVPPDQHGQIENTLIERNIPFLVEKPLSADRATAETIAEQIERKNLLVAVGYNWRALDTLPRLRKTLTENPPRMLIGAFHVNTPPAVWWRHQSQSGGQMVEQATHLIDLGRALIGEGAVLCAQTPVFQRPAYPDADIAGVSAALIRFESGAVGTYTASCLQRQGGKVELQFICEGMLITLTRSSITYQSGDQTEVDHPEQDSYAIQNQAFLNAIRQNNPDLIYSTYADALRTHHLCHDIVAQG
jgi:myo-inositol 2-dehydrogenase / D-chiro-inositol 1-dehydrogenase